MGVVFLGYRGVSSEESQSRVGFGGMDPMGGVDILNPKLQSYGLELPLHQLYPTRCEDYWNCQVLPRNLRVMLKF
jgi:hypothetical protein